MAISGNVIRISSGAALCALLTVPVACSSDSNGPSNDGGTGQETGTGSGGASNTGGKASTGGSAGKATGGSTSMGGSSGSTSNGGKGGTSTGGKTTSPEAGPDSSTTTGTPDSGAPDASHHDSGPKVPVCAPPTDASKARVCLTFDPEMITPTADPRMDNRGTLIVQAFDPASATPTTPIARQVFAPPQTPGAEDAGPPLDIDSLPMVDLDNMPTSVVINAYFVDNGQWFQTAMTDFTWGMYIGGYDLAAGIFPKPTPKVITLTAGQGTAHTMSLTALRQFTTTVKYALVQNMSLIGDGQGPLSVGAFDVSAAKGAPVRGGVVFPCKDVTKGDIPATGYFYKGGGDSIWLIGDLSDFNLPGLAQPGDVLALGGGQDGQSAPDSAKIDLSGNNALGYAFSVPAVTLNIVAPYPGTHAADYHCGP